MLYKNLNLISTFCILYTEKPENNFLHTTFLENAPRNIRRIWFLFDGVSVYHSRLIHNFLNTHLIYQMGGKKRTLSEAISFTSFK